VALNWIELSCRVHREAADAVVELFSRHAPGGVAIHDEAPRPLPIEDEPATPADEVRVAAYLPDEPDSDAAREAIARGLWLLGLLYPIAPLTERRLSEQDWATAWREHFHVLRVGQRLIIQPTWRTYEPQPGELVVLLDPGLAFGTGLHPSTQLCLLALERLVWPGARVLDLGTGSGILALAAARLGAQHVLALDVDPQAIDAATANVALNQLEERIIVRQGTLPSDDEPFDLIVANIVARVIADLAPHLARALRPGGTLIASGIIAERADDVCAALRAAGLRVTEQATRAPWVALVAHHDPPLPTSGSTI
jgi:ribosomal protein L11 methyltransferase